MKKIYLLSFALLLFLGCGSKPTTPEVETFKTQAIDPALVKKADTLLKDFSGKYRYKNDVLYYKTRENGEKPKRYLFDDSLDINDIYEELDYDISYANGILTLGNKNPFYLNQIEDSKIFFTTGTYETEIFSYLDNHNVPAKASEMLWIDVSRTPIEMDFKRETIRNVENSTPIKRSFEWLAHGQLILNPLERPKVSLSDLLGRKWTLTLISHDGTTTVKTAEFFDKTINEWSKMGDGDHLVLSLILEEENTMVGIQPALKDTLEIYEMSSDYDHSKNGLASLPFLYCLDNIRYTYLIYFEKDEEGNLIGKGKYRFIKGERIKSNEDPNFPDLTKLLPLKDNPIVDEGTVILKEQK